jgi:leucyl aminopeptidase
LQIFGGSGATPDEAMAMARGTMLTRYLVEAPPNVATPTHLAEAAALIASEFPEVGAHRARHTHLELPGLVSSQLC